MWSSWAGGAESPSSVLFSGVTQYINMAYYQDLHSNFLIT